MLRARPWQVGHTRPYRGLHTKGCVPGLRMLRMKESALGEPQVLPHPPLDTGHTVYTCN
jgi:hypothetical protein